jgi:hypothetical protein
MAKNAITLTARKATHRKNRTTKWGISRSHLTSHSPREADGSRDASTRTG